MAKATKQRTPKIGRCTRIEFKKKGKDTVTLRVVGMSDAKDMLDGKKSLPKPQTIDKTERDYFRDLHKLVDLIYDEAAALEWTWGRLADEAGICYATADNLGVRRTKRPQFRTVYKLAAAVGYALVPQELPKQKSRTKVKVKAA